MPPLSLLFSALPPLARMSYLRPLGNLRCAEAAIMLKNVPKFLLFEKCNLTKYVLLGESRHQTRCAKLQTRSIGSEVGALKTDIGVHVLLPNATSKAKAFAYKRAVCAHKSYIKIA